jgi:hypothetical protein
MARKPDTSKRIDALKHDAATRRNIPRFPTAVFA